MKQMAKSKLAALCVAVVGGVAASVPLAAPSKMVACTLFSYADLSSSVSPNLERTTTDFESSFSYGAMRSACGYYGPRHWVIVRLAEFSSLQEAHSEYIQNTRPSGGTKAVVVSGIGDKASWLEHTPSYSGTSFMYVVLKGKSVFHLLVVAKDETEGHVLMGRLRSLVQETADGL